MADEERKPRVLIEYMPHAAIGLIYCTRALVSGSEEHLLLTYISDTDEIEVAELDASSLPDTAGWLDVTDLVVADGAGLMGNWRAVNHLNANDFVAVGLAPQGEMRPTLAFYCFASGMILLAIEEVTFR